MESLLFTREDLKKLIVPLIIEQALALSIGLFDTLMVSSCGEAAVSGVSLVDSISTLLIQILSALATGGAVVCSQYIGKKMPERAKLSAGQLMLIMLLSAGTVMVVILLGHILSVSGRLQRGSGVVPGNRKQQGQHVYKSGHERDQYRR